MSDAPHTPAAFINSIAEEGSKKEAVEWLQKTWNERCHLERENEALRKKLSYYYAAITQAREEGRREGMLEAAEVVNKLAENWSKGDFCPDAYDCRDAITRAAEGKCS